MTDPDPFLYDDGPYVLGALDADERAAFEAHLETCPGCRARVAELRPTVGLLAGISLSALDDAPPVPDTLLPGLLKRARHEQTRRRVVTGFLAGTAAACLAGLAVVAWPSGSSAPAPKSVAFAAVRPSPVTATARLVAKGWGTEIELHCHYGEGVTHYLPYELVVTDEEHHTYVAGSWTLAPGHDTEFTSGIAVHRDDIASVQIRRPDGTPILQLNP